MSPKFHHNSSVTCIDLGITFEMLPRQHTEKGRGDLMITTTHQSPKCSEAAPPKSFLPTSTATLEPTGSGIVGSVMLHMSKVLIAKCVLNYNR